MTRAMTKTLGATLITLALAACGGGGSDGPDQEPDPDPVNPTTRFTGSATWTFTLPSAGSALCYDFDAAQERADCSGNTWDLKVASGGRSATLWTNSGVSGSGNGGAFGGPFDRSWSELSQWTDATVDPVDGPMPSAVYFKDTADGVFTGSNAIGVAAFEYGIDGGHLLHPNYRVFLITSDSRSADTTGTPGAPVFAVQVIGYYGGPSGVASGHPTIRWIDRAAPGNVRTMTVDASQGDAWVHIDLNAGAVVDASAPWHIAFNRYNAKLNGGDSGGGQVAGFVAKTPAGFYDADGAPVTSRFLSATPADTLAELTAADLATPAAAGDWVTDANASSLNPDYRGNWPQSLDYGWYAYHPSSDAAAAAGLQPPTAHLLSARPEGAALLRSGEGNSYARFHVVNIRYADPSNPSSAQTWTIEFDVQPAN
ncbi:MAG: HmuY family protein [Burkholderiaceae bacterium]